MKIQYIKTISSKFKYISNDTKHMCEKYFITDFLKTLLLMCFMRNTSKT